MNRLFSLLMLSTLVVVPCAVQAQSPMMSTSTIGAGPRGYDYMIGTWSCVNSMPTTALGFPARATLTVSKSDAVLFFHTTAKNCDVSSYNVYDAKKNAWMSPFIASDGTYGSESTTQTGKSVIWAGTLYDPSAGKMGTRDTYTNYATKYIDLGEDEINGTWKAEYRMTCTKS